MRKNTPLRANAPFLLSGAFRLCCAPTVSCSIRPLLITGLLALLCQCAAPPRRKETPAAAAAWSAPWNRVTETLSRAVPRDHRGKPVSWNFSVRKADGINARSWPDGRVEVTSGILTFVKNDAELAAVTAHEMAHVFCRHGRQRVMESWAVLLGGAALGTVLAHQDGNADRAWGIASGAVFTVSLTALTARQRDQEFEADRLSLDLLRRAGYPPQAAVAFWERYAAHRAGHGLGGRGWWKAHPPDAERVRRLRDMTADR